MSRREDPEYRLVRRPELDPEDMQTWEVQKRRPIFGYSTVKTISVHHALSEADLVEYALSIVNPKTIAL